jgi:hypothetical protein
VASWTNVCCWHWRSRQITTRDPFAKDLLHDRVIVPCLQVFSRDFMVEFMLLALLSDHRLLVHAQAVLEHKQCLLAFYTSCLQVFARGFMDEFMLLALLLAGINAIPPLLFFIYCCTKGRLLRVAVFVGQAVNVALFVGEWCRAAASCSETVQSRMCSVSIST